MHRLFHLILALVSLSLLGCAQSTVTSQGEHQGRLFTGTIIHEDMTWSGDIEVEGVFVVGRGATLTIQPGTTVRFRKIDNNNDKIGDSEIRVSGRIIAESAKELPEILPFPRRLYRSAGALLNSLCIRLHLYSQ